MKDHWIPAGCIISALLTTPIALIGTQVARADGAPPPSLITTPAPANLWQAAMVADRNWIDTYLRGGGDINARDRNGNTALLHAVGKGRCEFADYLLQHGADANAAGSQNWTPLIGASFHGLGDCVAHLLKAGARTDVLSADGYTAASYAIENSHPGVLRALLEHGADVNAVASARFLPPRTLLMLAAQRSDAAVLDVLLAHRPNLDIRDQQGRTAMFYAAQRNRLANLQRLQSAGMDIKTVDKRGNSLLHAVAKTGSWEMVRWLLQQGLDWARPNISGVTPLELFVSAGNLPVLEPLAAQMQPSQRVHLLHLATDAALQPMVEWLVKQGLSVDAVEADHRTLLMQAAAHGHVWLVKYLLRQHANVALQDKNGETALHYALLSNTPDIGLVKRLLQAGADKNRKDAAGRTPEDLIRALAADEKYRDANWQQLL